MPAFVHFFGISPRDYYQLTLAERAQMIEYMRSYGQRH